MPDMGDMGGFADLFETFFNGGFGGLDSKAVEHKEEALNREKVFNII